MMRNLKKWTAGLLSTAILFSLTTCSNGSATTSDSNAMSQLATTVALAAEPEAALGFADVPANADYADAVV